MKTLMLLRHAKSSWNNANLSDHDRPLNSRGKRDAPRMGRLLHQLDAVPHLIVSSTAVRAADTAEAVALASGFEGDIIYTPRLYHADPEVYLEIAQETDAGFDSILLVGHNPGLEELMEMLSGRPERMPTAALALFRVPVDQWSDVNGDLEFELVDLWRPKELS